MESDCLKLAGVLAIPDEWMDSHAVEGSHVMGNLEKWLRLRGFAMHVGAFGKMPRRCPAPEGAVVHNSRLSIRYT